VVSTWSLSVVDVSLSSLLVVWRNHVSGVIRVGRGRCRRFWCGGRNGHGEIKDFDVGATMCIKTWPSFLCALSSDLHAKQTPCRTIIYCWRRALVNVVHRLQLRHMASSLTPTMLSLDRRG
jgi:hypothetical protein